MTFPANTVEKALVAAIDDHSKTTDFLDVLSEAEVWLPISDESGPEPDGTVALPTITLDDEQFVAAFTSAEQLERGAPEVPHVVVPARDLAQVLPDRVGIAVNPGADGTVPIKPDGVAYLGGPSDDSDVEAEGS
ncbi:MAG: SseB family protein [Streptosporangiales bacterium]|nr:SseB family protein [Streptosporangiales bacterium]